MDQNEAITQIEDACKTISLAMMKVTPAARHLEDEAIRGMVTETSYKLTIELEVIKKQLIRLKGRDDSTDL